MSKEIQYLVSKGKRYRCLTRAAALEWLSAAVSWGTKENQPIQYPQVLTADSLDALFIKTDSLLGVTMETDEPYPFITSGGSFTFIANPAHVEVIPEESKYVPYEKLYNLLDDSVNNHARLVDQHNRLLRKYQIVHEALKHIVDISDDMAEDVTLCASVALTKIDDMEGD